MYHPDHRPRFARQIRLLAGLVTFVFAAVTAFAGFTIQNGLLIDNNGNEFILRGINYPHVWFPTQTATSIPNIAATGANCVRIVLGSGQQWGPTPAAEVAQLIQLCKDNKLIAVLEVHDCTGFGDTGGFAATAAPMATAVDYWLSIQSVLKGQENFVIINIANEPLGNGVLPSKWIGDNTDAITRLRAAGLTHTLMIDGATWGQDWDQTMMKNAGTVFAVDPLKNILFSVHMYQVYALRSTILNYLTTFVTAQIPLVVGEFGPDNGGAPADAASVMELSQTLGIGYMGWSWSGNSGGTESLDITLNFNPATLSTWGNNLINGPTGIAASSELASVFGNVPHLQLNPTTLSFATAAAQSATVNIKSNQSWTVSDNQDWITVATPTGMNDGSITVAAAANPNLGPRSGKVTVIGGTLSRTVTVSQLGTGGPGVCNNPVVSTLPLVQNGAGEFCWVTSGNIASVNCWNTQLVEINGVPFTNKFSNVLPPRINGSYYIHYVAGVSFAHLEIAGTAGTGNVPATGLTLTPATGSVARGASLALTATVAPANATNKLVTWASSDLSVATVNSSGLVAGVGAGTAIITATAQDGGFSATSTIVVPSSGGVTGVTVTPTTGTVVAGSTIALTATVSPASAINKTLTWTSSATSIATVNASGVVTGVATGSAVITAKTVDGGFTASSTISVTPLGGTVVTGVTVTPTTASVGIGAPTTLTATVAPATAANKTVTWSSSAPAIASVNQLGVVTGLASGNATITVTTQSGGFTASSVVTVAAVSATPCANPAAIVLPFVRNGAGDFCYVTAGTVSFINSWNMQKIEINGVDFSNKWSNSLPPRINGNYYIHYVANVAWAHLEINGTP